MMENKELSTEWCLLQKQFDSYEKHSIYIKHLAVLVLRLIKSCGEVEIAFVGVEEMIASASEGNASQFNREFYKIRLTGLALIIEYVRQAIRPTVAFPYFALALILLADYFLLF